MERRQEMMRGLKICICFLGLYGCGDTNSIPPPLGPFEAMIAFAVVVRQVNGIPQTEIFLQSTDGRRMKVSQNPTCFNRSPALSPAGDKVIFVSCTSSTGQDLFRVSADGSQTQNITHSTEFEDRPVWSPDGSRIAYESTAAGKQDIVVSDSGGRQFIRIADSSANITLGGWSPNGNALVYSAQRRDSAVGQIFSARIETMMTLQLTSGAGKKTNPAWSSSGNFIAYVREGKLRIMNADGTGDTLLVSSPDSVTGHITWSSHDDWLIFEARNANRTDVYKISRDGRTSINLSGNVHPASSPVLSSDDRIIAYVADLMVFSKIYLMAPDGSEKRALTPFDNNEMQPTWRRSR